MGTDYVLLCPGTKRRLDIQGEGSGVQRAPDGTVTAEALAIASGGRCDLRVDAALWVQAQGGTSVFLVSEHEGAYDDGCGPDWTQETLFGPNAWQKRLRGHGVFLPSSWGIQGTENPKGMARLKIVR